MQISFIGFGNIAKAVAAALDVKNYAIFAAAPSLNIGITPAGIRTHYDNVAVLDNADVVILAIKPAKMAEVLNQIKDFVPEKTLLVSLAAGLNLTFLAKYCRKTQAIVRCMPNICTAIKKGATPLLANSFVSEEQKNLISTIFAKLGIIAWVSKEAELDIFTALSGSGPAYVFLFLEALQKAAIKLGMSAEVAKKFSVQTVVGAANLAQESEFSFAQLRKNVTSPQGTTAAAIAEFTEKGFEQLVFSAMEKAYLRAKELGESADSAGGS